jgi:hypothetical protein
MVGMRIKVARGWRGGFNKTKVGGFRNKIFSPTKKRGWCAVVGTFSAMVALIPKGYGHY